MPNLFVGRRTYSRQTFRDDDISYRDVFELQILYYKMFELERGTRIQLDDRTRREGPLGRGARGQVSTTMR